VAEVKRGIIESTDLCGVHLAEMAKIVAQQHQMPLIVMAHSLTASAFVFSTRRVVELSDGHMAAAIYLAPPPPGLAPAFCPDCCFSVVCPALCCCVCPIPKAITPGLNPDNVLGENRNATKLYLSNLCPNMCLAPHTSDGNRPRNSAARMAAELHELDAGVAARIFAGSQDKETVSAARFEAFASKGPSTLTAEMIPGAKHDMLSTDPQALENIDRIFAYIGERLEGR
jgi:hypothetical protein